MFHVVKKIIKRRRKYRNEYTRDDFVKYALDWKEEYENRIMKQSEKNGCLIQIIKAILYFGWRALKIY